MSNYNTLNAYSASSSGSTSAKAKLEQELRCPQCKRWFQRPLLLPCGHSLCTPCSASSVLSAEEAMAGASANSHQNAHHDQNPVNPDMDDQMSLFSETDSGVVVNSRPGSYVGGGSGNANLPGVTRSSSVVNLYMPVSQGAPVQGIVCPLCRRVALLDNRGIDCLLKNRALENVVEKYSLELEDESDMNLPVCQLCDDSDPQVAASLCEQCEIFYCELCLQRCHPQRGPLAKHALHEARAGRVVLRQKRKQRESEQVHCSEHTKETLSLYCCECRRAVCCVCLQDCHHRHEAMPLNQICKNQKAELSKLLQSLSEKAKSGTEFIQSLKAMQEKINPNSHKFEDTVIEQIDSMISVLEEKKTTLLGHVKNERDHKIRTYKEQIAQSTATLSKSTSLIQFCIEMLKESDSTAFLQVSHALLMRASLAEQYFLQEMEMRPRVSSEFEIRVDTENLEKTIRSLGFNEFKAPNPPMFSHEECCAEGNVVTIVWRATPGSSVDYFTLELAENRSGSFKKVYRGPDNICTIEGLHFKAVYRVRVKAHNHAGESSYSEPICIQTAELAWFTLDPIRCSPEILFSNNNMTITSQSMDERVVLSATALSKGVHYWEFTIDRYDGGVEPAFGVARLDCNREMMLGRDCSGWSLYIDSKRSWFMHANEHFERCDGGISQGSVVGIRLDCNKGTLSYYLNDEPHGPIAFTGLSGVFYPAVSLNRNVQVTLHTGIEVPSESEESSEDDNPK